MKQRSKKSPRAGDKAPGFVRINDAEVGQALAELAAETGLSMAYIACGGLRHIVRQIKSGEAVILNGEVITREAMLKKAASEPAVAA